MENKGKYSANIIFWNVDTQFDFIDPHGKLYVQGAELIKSNLKKLTQLAKEKSIRVVSTADYHFMNSPELSDSPDFYNTFPPHCMGGTPGAEFINETAPDNPLIFDWNKIYNEIDLASIHEHRNIVIRKDAFDVFAGNQNTDSILELFPVETVVVYGVTTNVCVNFAVIGLARRVKKVIVVNDAIKELPNLPLPFKIWESNGIKMLDLADLGNILN